MPYQIRLHRSAEKFLASLTPETRSRARKAIDALATEPRPRGCLKLKGSDVSWRIRIGKFRVIYDVLENELLIWVFKVDRRGESTYDR